MGKSAKKLRASKRMAARRQAKAARRALYASYAGSGQRKKKQRGATGRTPARGNHVMADCGNPGCRRCQPQLVRLFGASRPLSKAAKAAAAAA